ncbi:MAG: hypothetical protein NTV93_19560 [Verrucomicrobia bacterium]|nr:hypothetical protein [Verrucomicrobiota bacterium]
MKTILLAILSFVLLIAPASRLSAVCQKPPGGNGNEGKATPSPTPSPTPTKPAK